MHKPCFIMAPHLVVEEKPNPSVASTAKTARTARATNGRTKIVTRPPSWTQKPAPSSSLQGASCRLLLDLHTGHAMPWVTQYKKREEKDSW